MRILLENRTLLLGIGIVILLCFPRFTQEDGKWINNIELPTTIAAIENRLGEADTVIIPEPDPLNPVGQWFLWEMHAGQVTMVALADDYSQLPGRRAGVRFIRLIANNDTLRVPTIYGLELNGTRRVDLESRFSRTLEDSRLFDLKSPHDGTWDYFRFRFDGTLREVAQSSFDVDQSELYHLDRVVPKQGPY